MSILIRKSGLLTTVQDLGRYGFRRFGINPGGVMDQTAARLINVLLGNDENEAVLEMHFPAAEIVFEEPVVFALGGADFSSRLDGAQIENWRPVRADRGSRLLFDDKLLGSRVYLSVKGGFQIDHWLGSTSTNLRAEIGGFAGRRLQKGDRLGLKNPQSDLQNLNYKISHALVPFYSRFPTVRILPGAEYELLTASSREDFLEENFVVSPKSDRMGFRLDGRALGLERKKELVSSAVGFGTIQLLPDGQLVVLMADHQTTGGYPRLGHVISTDLPLVAQLGPLDKVGFQITTIARAERLALEFERDLNLLRLGSVFRHEKH